MNKQQINTRRSTNKTLHVAHPSRAVPANRLRHSTNTERFLLTYLVCNVEYSHLPNSARTELLHEDRTSRYIAVRYCFHFQTTPIAGCKQKCGLDLSLLLSVSYVWSDDTGYDCAGPPTGVAVCSRLLGGSGAILWKKSVKHSVFELSN